MFDDVVQERSILGIVEKPFFVYNFQTFRYYLIFLPLININLDENDVKQ